MSTDPFLRRLESMALIVCAGMAVLALVVSGWRPAASVIGGGLLVAFSYWTIRSGVNTLADSTRGAPPRVGAIMVRVLTRYALLVLLAYVMIARLRLHPLGLLAGASSVVAAASVEAFRLLLKKS